MGRRPRPRNRSPLESVAGVGLVEKLLGVVDGNAEADAPLSSKRESAKPTISPVSAKKTGPPLSPGTIEA